MGRRHVLAIAAVLGWALVAPCTAAAAQPATPGARPPDVGPAGATGIPSPGTPADITVDEFVARALAEHPELRAARAEIDAAAGRLRQAGLRPNPMLDLGGQKALGPDNNVLGGLTIPLDLSGRREGRIGIAEQELAVRRAQLADRERRLRADVRLKAGEVSLTPEAVERTGIRTAVVRAETSTETLTVPGTIFSNAYRETRVNALVGGIVRQVPVELGTPVGQGQALALVFSTELADAQTRYLATRALLHADEQKRRRTEALVAIGAASRQELEEVTAGHASHETELAALRQRLLWLGLADDEVARLDSPARVVAEVTVAAPADGVVITRSVNPGQVVGAGQELFVVADLATVWAIGDLYEKDASAVGVGSEARVALPSTPATSLRGRVAYIDPRVDPATRTAKVRVEVPNPDGALRLGMYVTLAFRTGPGRRSVIVPRSAVQAVGDRWVVYVSAADDQARFVERRVRLGEAAGDRAEVLEGLQPGEHVPCPVRQGQARCRVATRIGPGYPAP